LARWAPDVTHHPLAHRYHPPAVAEFPVQHLGVQAGPKIVEVLASDIQTPPHLQGHHWRGQDLGVGMLQGGARPPAVVAKDHDQGTVARLPQSPVAGAVGLQHGPHLRLDGGGQIPVMAG
jgi:hypothetical protein